MRILKESFQNLRRNRFLTFVSILSISLILLIFNVLLTVNTFTKSQIDHLANKISLNIYVENHIPKEDITKLQGFISELPEVDNVKLITNEEALKNIQNKYPDSTEFLSEFNISNPLPNTLQVSTFNLEDKEEVIKLINKSPYKHLVLESENKAEYNQTIRSVIANLNQIKNFSFQIILWIMITFVIAGSLIMFNAIKTTLFTRRNEIQIMQFVGATFKRIISPFILEGVLIGIFGFLLNLIFLLILNNFLPFNTFTLFQNPLLAPTQLLGVIFIGIFTSTQVVNKYLKTREIFQE